MVDQRVAKPRREPGDYQLVVEFEPAGGSSKGGVRFLYESRVNHYPENKTYREKRINLMTWEEWDRLVAWISSHRADEAAKL